MEWQVVHLNVSVAIHQVFSDIIPLIFLAVSSLVSEHEV